MIVAKTQSFISSDFKQRLSKEIASFTDRISIPSAHLLMVLSTAHVAYGNPRWRKSWETHWPLIIQAFIGLTRTINICSFESDCSQWCGVAPSSEKLYGTFHRPSLTLLWQAYWKDCNQLMNSSMAFSGVKTPSCTCPMTMFACHLVATRNMTGSKANICPQCEQHLWMLMSALPWEQIQNCSEDVWHVIISPN